VSGGPQRGVGEGLGRFGASASFGRSLDEVERTSLFLPFFLLTDQVSPQQRAESGERSQRYRGGPGEGLGRSVGVGALAAVAGRGGDELFSSFCRDAVRVRLFQSFENEMYDAIGAVAMLPSKQQQQQQQQQQQISRVAHLVRESRSQSTTAS
jgi:hypothetical protein